MKSRNKKIYDKLKKDGLSDEDIVDAIVFPSELTKKEKKEQDKILMEIINKKRNEKK